LGKDILTKNLLPILNRGSVHFLGRLKFSGNIASKADHTLQSLGLARVLRSQTLSQHWIIHGSGRKVKKGRRVKGRRTPVPASDTLLNYCSKLS
jgi:hypothetical protein